MNSIPSTAAHASFAVTTSPAAQRVDAPAAIGNVSSMFQRAIQQQQEAEQNLRKDFATKKQHNKQEKEMQLQNVSQYYETKEQSRKKDKDSQLQRMQECFKKECEAYAQMEASQKAAISAVGNASDKSTTIKNVIQVYIDSKDYELAHALLRKELQASSQDAQLYLQQAICYRHQSQFAEALPDYEKAIELGQKHWKVFIDLEIYQIHIGKIDKAIKSLSQALAKGQNEEERMLALFKKGGCLLMKGEGKEGLSDLKEVQDQAGSLHIELLQCYIPYKYRQLSSVQKILSKSSVLNRTDKAMKALLVLSFAKEEDTPQKAQQAQNALQDLEENSKEKVALQYYFALLQKDLKQAKVEAKKFEDLFKKREGGSLSWFLNHPEFSWVKEDCAVLYANLCRKEEQTEVQFAGSRPPVPIATQEMSMYELGLAAVKSEKMDEEEQRAEPSSSSKKRAAESQNNIDQPQEKIVKKS